MTQPVDPNSRAQPRNDTPPDDAHPHNANGVDWLDVTQRVWQPYSRRTLSREDARQIVQHVTSFLQILQTWTADRRMGKVKADDENRLVG